MQITSVEQFCGQLGPAAELDFTGVVIAWPRAAGPFAGDEKILGAIADELNSGRGT